MTQTAVPDLRELIASTVREVVAEMVGDSVGAALAGSPPEGSATSVGRSHPARPLGRAVARDGRERIERVRIADDADLAAFALHLLHLFENPKNRQDLRAGRIRFSLADGGQARAVAGPPVQRVDRGAVTERQVTAAAEAGRALVLGKRAVLTPLAREKARTLGVQIEKER